MILEEFLNTDLRDYASYSTVRQIASYVDGLKNGSRKVVFTLLEKRIKEKLKVLQLSNKCAEYADYLHGSLDGVVVSLGAHYTGTNNIPLVQAYGNFGSRLAPENAAPRYIFGCAHENLFKLFDSNDSPNLTYQIFEGARIEPKFYVPNLPMLLVNGSTGLATGYAQNILPRNPENLKKYCQKYIEGKLTKKDSKLLDPYVNGFKGTFVRDEINPLKWYIKGVIERTDKTHLKVSEMPLNFDYKSAVKHFDKLLDNKVIQDYDDLCDTKADTFTFVVKMTKADLDEMSEEQLLDKLKLVQTYTENLTTLNENLKIREFDKVEDIIDAYMKIKLEYNLKRKEYLLSKIQYDVDIDLSKITFIKKIIDGSLVIAKKKKEVIEKELEKIKEIKKKDESYDYLLSMPLYSLTKERMDKLAEEVKALKENLSAIKGKTPEMIFLEDLK
jgi:DNA topoisomerase-2